MIKKNITLRVARPSNNLGLVSKMYEEGLGFKILSYFENHEGFDGIILGHPNHSYHLEFTNQRGAKVENTPTKDNLLVFYIEEILEWETACKDMSDAGFTEVSSLNPYWNTNGKTFEDPDGYRVVLCNRSWTK